MFRLIKKITVYGILLLLLLEVLVRVFYLYNERPTRYIDDKGIQKWIPGQEGFTVYGNRRQVFSKYHINKSGFNSYREFVPTMDGLEVALVGDSFIEGFHQNYYNSIGKKVENLLNNSMEVYEYGHSSNDFADQLHIIDSYKDKFDLIDYVILGLKFENDLTRSEYHLIKRQPVLPILRNSKLYIYLQTIGFLDPLKDKALNAKSSILRRGSPKEEPKKNEIDNFFTYLKNFQLLVKHYNYDKSKMVMLLDSRITDVRFLEYLDSNDFSYIDIATALERCDRPTTLIYDQHWNNHGRNIVAKVIADHLIKRENKK